MNMHEITGTRIRTIEYLSKDVRGRRMVITLLDNVTLVVLTTAGVSTDFHGKYLPFRVNSCNPV